MSARRYDVAIVGGGPAGCALALSLRAQSPELDIIVIEASTYDQFRIGETLSANAQPLLEKLGVWSRFLSNGHLQSVGISSTWGGGDLTESDHLTSLHGPSWHLDRRRFDNMLAEEVFRTGARMLTGTSVTNIDRDANVLVLRLRDDDGYQEIRARFVADASGRMSRVARPSGTKRVLLDKLVGAFTYFDKSQSDEAGHIRTLIEPVKDGWWYSASLPDGRLVAALMTDADIAHGLKLHKPSAFHRALAATRHTEERTNSRPVVRQTSLHAAAVGYLDSSVGKDWLAVGDAASTLDPLSGQGLVKALSSSIWASFAIADHLSGKNDALARYQKLATQEFESHLATRDEFFSEEQRWPEVDFWQRRQPQITLHPEHSLVVSAPSIDAALARLPMHLSTMDLRHICRQCSAPRAAGSVVAEVTQNGRMACSERRIVLALQYLLDEAVIEVAG